MAGGPAQTSCGFMAGFSGGCDLGHPLEGPPAWWLWRPEAVEQPGAGLWAWTGPLPIPPRSIGSTEQGEWHHVQCPRPGW